MAKPVDATGTYPSKKRKAFPTGKIFLKNGCPGEHGLLFWPEGFVPTGLSKEYQKNQDRLIQKIYEVDPPTCLKGGSFIKIGQGLGEKERPEQGET